MQVEFFLNGEKVKIEVDMVKSGDTYRVRRFSVSTIPQ